MEMVDDENDAVIVRATIDLAHNLGLRTVAEGVTSQEIWSYLEFLQCDIAQGYYIARPVKAPEFMQKMLSKDWMESRSAEAG
jgi:EAL domain-containing protein (putative c-di-GMP-specific phosphodiesterase class I)